MSINDQKNLNKVQPHRTIMQFAKHHISIQVRQPIPST